MINIGESPDQKKIAAVLGSQRDRISFWKRKCLQSGLTFVIMVGLTSLFLAGAPLHHLWEQVGQLLLLATFAAMIWALYGILLLWGAYSQHWEFKNKYSSEDKGA